jgi:CBS domain-containing protein
MDLMSEEEAGSCCVAEVMGTELYTLTPDTVVASAKRLARDNGIEHLLVLDNGTLTGIVCGDDLRTAARDALVGECMSSPVLCVGPDTSLQDAVDIMAENDIGCLPVVTGAFLVGMITLEALTSAGLTEDEPEPDDACVACATTEDVRRDPRASCLPLCGDCLGRTAMAALDPQAD